MSFHAVSRQGRRSYRRYDIYVLYGYTGRSEIQNIISCYENGENCMYAFSTSNFDRSV